MECYVNTISALRRYELGDMVRLWSISFISVWVGFVLMVESIVASAIDKALETVLRKVGEGKKLSTEDLVVLMLGLFQGIRKDVTETNKRIDALYDLVGRIYDLMGKNYEALSRKIDETNKRIDAINDSLSKRVDALYELMSKNYEALNRRIEETNKRIDGLVKDVNELRESINKRIDTLYDLLGKIYQTLIKQETTQRQ